jgi:hypothetical protein
MDVNFDAEFGDTAYEIKKAIDEAEQMKRDAGLHSDREAMMRATIELSAARIALAILAGADRMGRAAETE